MQAPDFTEVTFDDSTVNYTLTGFGGAEDSTIIADPNDATNNVAQVNRADNAETFAGTIIGTEAGDTVGPIPFDMSNTILTVRTLSPAAGVTVRLAVENDVAGQPSQRFVDAQTTTAGAFETLTFDFGDAGIDLATEYNRIVIFFNFGTAGTGAVETYLFDDVIFAGGGGIAMPPAPFDVIDFDDAMANYSLTGFGGAEDSQVVADPNDATNNVARVNRADTAETFAGTIVGDLPGGLVGTVPFDVNNTILSVRTLSPAAGVTVRLAVENDVAGQPSQRFVDAQTTAAGAWETLNFDFGTAGLDFATEYNRIIIFFNFGAAGSGSVETYYFDDVLFAGGGGVPADFSVVDFDDAMVNYTLTGFGGAEASSIVVDPSDATNMVAQVDRAAAAATFAGTIVGTEPGDTVGPIPFDSNNTILTVRTFSPAAGVTVRLAVENAAIGQPSQRFVDATTTVAGSYETLTFDFGTAGLDLATTYNRIVIFFRFGEPGTGSIETYYFDDLTFAGGGGIPLIVPADGADAVVEQTATVADVAAGGAAIGDRAAGSVYVIPFQLPAIPMGGFTGATLNVYLDNVVVNDAGNPVELDLYGLPSAAAPDVLASMYYSGPTADPNASLLVEGIASNATAPMTSIAFSDPALVNYINAEIAGGAVAGDYVFLRFGPDLAAPLAGATTFIFTTQEGGPPANLPTLVLQ